MEKKTIGSFIAALRKANGMTQRELAERLNVSDKTVSRWERDDGTPELALIPVLAEIFGVTCDELLRGERRPLSERRGGEEAQEVSVAGNNVLCEHGETFSTKGKKQYKRLLAVSLSKYKTKTFIAMGISVVGLLAAMIGNLGFLRSTIGFLAGAVFYLAGIVCQAVFVNGAFLAVEDEGSEAEEVGQFKKTVIWLAEFSVGMTLVLFAGSLPLILFGLDTYSGLGADSWLQYGFVCGGLMLLVFIVICFFLNAYLLKKGVYSIGEREETIYLCNRQLKIKCTVFVIIGMFLTYVLHFVVTCGFNPHELAEETFFYDFESFVTYMEQPTPRNNYVGNGPVTAIEVESIADEAITYYDQHGNEISREEALREEIRDANGNVVCEYIRYNENVCITSWSSKEDGSILPISVVTYDDVYQARIKLKVINAGFALIYGLECVLGIWLYFKKCMRKYI